jgi:hypothetical protein
MENPVIALGKKDKKLLSKFNRFSASRATLIKHPFGLDLAAIPFLPPHLLPYKTRFSRKSYLAFLVLIFKCFQSFQYLLRITASVIGTRNYGKK